MEKEDIKNCNDLIVYFQTENKQLKKESNNLKNKLVKYIVFDKLDFYYSTMLTVSVLDRDIIKNFNGFFIVCFCIIVTLLYGLFDFIFDKYIRKS